MDMLGSGLGHTSLSLGGSVLGDLGVGVAEMGGHTHHHEHLHPHQVGISNICTCEESTRYLLVLYYTP